MEENKVMVEEKKGLTTKQKLLTAGGIVAAGVIGFKAGKAYEFNAFAKAFNVLSKADPTFLQNWTSAMNKAREAYGVK